MESEGIALFLDDDDDTTCQPWWIGSFLRVMIHDLNGSYN